MREARETSAVPPGSPPAIVRAPARPPRRRRRSAHCAVRAASRCRRSRQSARPSRQLPRMMRCRVDVDSVAQRLPHGNAHDGLAGLARADRRSARHHSSSTPTIAVRSLRHAGDRAFLDRRVMLHRAVAIEMIFAEIDQDADRRIERGREIDLIGRALDDVNAARRWRRKRQDRGADIAANLRVHAGRCRKMRNQRRRRRLAVGAGDGDERRVGRDAAALAAEQFDVADHLDAGFLRELDGPMRRRMGERNAGRQHQRRELRPISAAQIGGRDAGGVGLRHALRIVVVGDDIGAAGHERAGARQPRAAQPEHGDLFAGKGRDRNHDESYRSFKVDSPASASTTETIQNRMTICGSVQPSCSK